MRNDRKIDVSFSPRTEDVVRRFIEGRGDAPCPTQAWSQSLTWWIEGTFTDKVDEQNDEVRA